MIPNPAHVEVYSMQHYVIKLVSDLRQIGGFLLVLRFPPLIKLTPRYNWNIVESGVKHHNHNPFSKGAIFYRDVDYFYGKDNRHFDDDFGKFILLANKKQKSATRKEKKHDNTEPLLLIYPQGEHNKILKSTNKAKESVSGNRKKKSARKWRQTDKWLWLETME